MKDQTEKTWVSNKRNQGESLNLGLTFQIRNSLNFKLSLNQETQFNVEGWNKKNISI
jgi:hypothetical protein